MDNLNNITYADDWKEAYEPVYVESATNNSEVLSENKKVKSKPKSIPLLIIIQIVLSAIVVLSAYGIKLLDGEIYSTTKAWYTEQYNNEIIKNSDFKSFNLNSIISKLTDNFNNDN